MVSSRGKFYFAPNISMADLDFEDTQSLMDAFKLRVKGYFLQPARFLEKMEDPDSGLFACALICAATIEFVARIDPLLHQNRRPIAGWLERYVPEFSVRISGKSAAEFFEERFRNGLAHHGYIASFGRLGHIDDVISLDQDVVTINPFQLVQKLDHWLDTFVTDLRGGKRDVQAFSRMLKELFEDEVARAREELEILQGQAPLR